MKSEFTCEIAPLKPETLQSRMATHWHGFGLRAAAHAQGNFAAAAEFAALRRDWEQQGGQGGRPGFLREYVAAAVAGGEKGPSVGMQYKLWSAADAHDAGLKVDSDAEDAWESFCAAGRRLSQLNSAGATRREAAASVQEEIEQGVVRTRAAKPQEAPEGTVSVLLPDVSRNTEERLFERVRTVAAARKLNVPGGAPELRALLTESLAALPDDVLPAVLDGWRGWTVLRDDVLSDLLARAGMA